MKKLLAIALLSMVGISSTATAYWGWGRGYYSYGGCSRYGRCGSSCSSCNTCGYYN